MLGYFAGDSDVVQQGLTSPWIPKGWQWGGTISDHYPLWAELFTKSTGSEGGSDEGESNFSKALEVMQLAKPLAAAGDS